MTPGSTGVVEVKQLGEVTIINVVTLSSNCAMESCLWVKFKSPVHWHLALKETCTVYTDILAKYEVQLHLGKYLANRIYQLSHPSIFCVQQDKNMYANIVPAWSNFKVNALGSIAWGKGKVIIVCNSVWRRMWTCDTDINLDCHFIQHEAPSAWRIIES